MDSASQIKIGAIVSYFSIGINILIGLFYTPWVIHSIGKNNYGLYTLAQSVIALFVFDFGLSSAVTRFLAKYIAEGAKKQTDNCLGLICKIYLFIDVIIFLILTCVFFFIPYIYREFSPEELNNFKVVYCIASVFSILSFPFIPVNGVLNANEKFIQTKLCDLAHRLIIVVLMSGCLLLGYGLYALVSVYAVSGLMTIALKLICIRSFTSTRVNFFYHNKKELFGILSYSGWMTVVAIAQRCIFNIAPSILGIFSGSETIAVFGVAMVLEEYIFTFAAALNGMFLPKVSRIALSNQSDILPLMIKVGRIQILIIGLIIIGFFILGHDFICLWLGPSFQEAFFCTVFLIIPSFIQLPEEIATTAIAVMNQVKLQAYAFSAMAFVNIILSLLFTSLWGIIGLSLSICIAYLVRTAGMNIIYYKVLRIDIFCFFRESFFKMGIPLLVTLGFGLLLNNLIIANKWPIFIAKGMLFSLTYCSVMFFFAMNLSERQLVSNSMKHVLSIIKKS